MSHLNNEWTVLEKLLLTQAVYKYGENMWFQVARVLKQHGLIQQQALHRQSDFYSQKNCSFQYYLLVESMEAEKQILRNDLRNDMPVVVRLARQLYAQRVEEIKSQIQKEQEEFSQLSFEIDSIKSGKWDEKLKEHASSILLHTDEAAVAKGKEEDIPLETTEVENTILLAEGVMSPEKHLKRTLSESGLQTQGFKRCRSDGIDDQVASTAICEIKKGANVVQNDSLKTVLNVDVEHIETSDQGVTSPAKEAILSNTEAGLSTMSPEETNEQRDAVTNANIGEANETTPIIEETKKEEHANLESKQSGLPKIIIPEQTSNQQDQLDEEDFTQSETATPTSKRSTQQTNSDQRQKAWQKNIYLLWQEIANHKNGTMFMNPIKKSYAPLYDEVVKQPLYLRTIKNRVRDGIVRTTTEFERDVVLMLTNSLMYNKEGTEMYLMALEMLDDVREQIRLFKSADSYSMSLWEADQ